MFENLEFEDWTTLSPINDTGGACSMVKRVPEIRCVIA